jgi:hypothetical protein
MGEFLILGVIVAELLLAVLGGRRRRREAARRTRSSQALRAARERHCGPVNTDAPAWRRYPHLREGDP